MLTLKIIGKNPRHWVPQIAVHKIIRTKRLQIIRLNVCCMPLIYPARYILFPYYGWENPDLYA